MPGFTPAALPFDEGERLARLADFDILDTAPEEEFDSLTRLAASICGTPIALVSLVDSDRQWFKSRVGLDSSETGRNVSFCAHVITDPTSLLEVSDTLDDERFRGNPLVTGDPKIRFYAGAPLVDGPGSALGSLCVIDREPRRLTNVQHEALKILAQAVVSQLKLRRRLARSNAYLDAFAKHFPSPVWIKNHAGQFVMGNTALLDRFRIDAKALVGKTKYDFLPEDAADRIRQEDEAVFRTNRPHRSTTSADGRHWLVHKFPMDVSGERLLGAAAIDVTEQVNHERLLERHDQFHRVFAAVSAAALRANDIESLCLDVCRLAVALAGLKRACIARWEGTHSTLRLLAWADKAQSGSVENIEESARPACDCDLAQEVLASNCICVSNDVASDPRIPSRTEKVSAGRVAYGIAPLMVDGNAWGIVAMDADRVNFFDEFYLDRTAELTAEVSFAIDRLQKTKDLQYLSFYDVPTGLPNLDLLQSKFRTITTEAMRGCLLLIEISRQNEILTAYGPTALHAVVKQAAERIRANAQPEAMLACVRQGVFAVFVPDVTPTNFSRNLSQRPAEEFELTGTYHVDQQEIACPAYTGAAFFPDDGTSIETLLAAAENALQRTRGANEPFGFYDMALGKAAMAYVYLESKLRRAIGRRELINYYQPKMNLLTGRIEGVEALMRWLDPVEGVISPAQFIPALESSGLIVEAGRQVFERAIHDWHLWNDAGLAPPRIAVNVAPLQLRNSGLITVIDEIFTKHRGEPRMLCIELTESSLLADTQVAHEILAELRERGIPVAIDDFGTGYSSLAYLVHLPIDTLKIDRAFVDKMDNSPAYLGLVNTIITLAHNLNLSVVAEGVETEEQAKLLRLLRCDEAQGYLYSRPVRAEDLGRFLSAPAVLSTR